MNPPLQQVIRQFADFRADRSPEPLPPEQVHVWHWDPVVSSVEVEGLWRILGDDEQERAERFHFPKHRNEFVIHRARMRILLAAYLSKSPEQLVFEYSPHGKPTLRDACNYSFNLSHTEGRAALALVQAREIGIDVEQIRPQADARKIAERFFSANERQSLLAFSGDALDQGFFRCWTRKEAYIKAKGEGLSIPLHQFDVSLTEGEPAVLLGTRPDAEEASRWDLYDLPLGAGYAAALAVAADTPSLLK